MALANAAPTPVALITTTKGQTFSINYEPDNARVRMDITVNNNMWLGIGFGSVMKNTDMLVL